MRVSNSSNKAATVFALMALLALTAESALAGGVYYIAPTGGNDAQSGSQAAPWATFSKAWATMLPGDTLILRDGTYYQALKPTISGTPSAPITIRAENDGGAVIDGQSVRIPCWFTTTSTATNPPRDRTDIVVEGIQCKNSSDAVVIVSFAQRITLRRVSGYNAGVGTDSAYNNVHVFSLSWANDILVEDAAASGPGRKMFDAIETQRVTFRRCWGRWVYFPIINGPKEILNPYGSDDTLIENCVGTKNPASTQTVQGMGVWAHYYNDTADRNKFYGNVVYGLSSWSFYDNSLQHRTTDNLFINNVSINAPYGFFQRGDANLRVEKMTLVGISTTVFAVQAQPEDPAHTRDPDFAIKGDVRNSLFLNGGTGFSRNISEFPVTLTHSYNNLYGLTSNFYGTAAGAGERCDPPGQCAASAIDPNFDTARYGKGAYLIGPVPLKGKGEAGGDIGAEVLYRYQDGVLTDVPLWPWPMEERILRETGFSPTWESQGGLWKTLDGVYAPAAPPAAPASLRVF